MDHLLSYVAHSVVWRAVGSAWHDLPGWAQLVAAGAAGAFIVSRRRPRVAPRWRGSSRQDRSS